MKAGRLLGAAVGLALLAAPVQFAAADEGSKAWNIDTLTAASAAGMVETLDAAQLDAVKGEFRYQFSIRDRFFQILDRSRTGDATAPSDTAVQLINKPRLRVWKDGSTFTVDIGRLP